MIGEIVTVAISAASSLLGEIATVFGDVIALLMDFTNSELTELGTIVVATAGFALAWAGVRFIFGFVNRLLTKTRGSAR